MPFLDQLHKTFARWQINAALRLGSLKAADEDAREYVLRFIVHPDGRRELLVYDQQPKREMLGGE